MDRGDQHYQFPLHYGATIIGGVVGGEDQHMGITGTTQVLQVLQPNGKMVPESQIRMEPLGGFFGNDNNGINMPAQGRWPRQETLALLEIRSRLDHKFKEATHKAPLWAEVSRIMAVEYGYQRSEKKCREKLENLYKYYKKTKDGKAGRQDGKSYRFFSQLEALYGGSSSSLHATGNALMNSSYSPMLHLPNVADGRKGDLDLEKCMSLSNSFDLTTSSDDDEEEEEEEEEEVGNDRKNGEKARVERGRKGWWSRMEEFVESEIRKVMEVEEAWVETLLKTLEQKEQERVSREDEWRRREGERLDKESRSWATERAWIEARDAALMDALGKIISHSGKNPKLSTPEDESFMEAMEGVDVTNEQGRQMGNRRWPEPEITTLIKLRTSMEERFREGGCPKMSLWEEISAHMQETGYRRSAKRCKEKWENINKYFRKTKECNKKRRENSKTCPYYKHLEALYSQGIFNQKDQKNEPSSSSNMDESARSQDCFYLLFDGGESLWEDGGSKHNDDH